MSIGSVGARHTTERRRRRDDPLHGALGELPRLDLAAQAGVGELGPKGMQAGVERSCSSKCDSSRDRGRMSERQLAVAGNDRVAELLDMQSAPSSVRWTRTLRRSASSRRRASSPSLPIVSSARVIAGLVTPSFLARPRTVCGGGSR